jgi:cell wall-associated NlpC family hydrolase
VRRSAGLALALALSMASSAPVFAASTAASGRTMAMIATAYGPTLQDNYPYGPVDAFGRPLKPGDVAVDPRVIPLKTCLYVTGYQDAQLPAGGFYGEAVDTGGAIRGNRVDLFINASEAQVNAFGIQRVQVTVLGPPTNPGASGTLACQGYAEQTHPRDTSSGATGTVGTPATPSKSSATSLADAVVQWALAEVGRPYVWGGTTPAGFDCSGLVQWVFAKVGIHLPRLSGQQYRVGVPVDRQNLRPGDLVFFTTYKPGPSHVGIYIGSYHGIAHAFVAADNPAVGVEIDNLNAAKWTLRYVGARRVLP